MTEEEQRVLAGGGEMGARMRARDWSQTPLGPVASWPASLRTAVGVVLTSPYPVALFWGPELITLYNDSFGPLIGDKHPLGLGMSMPQLFSEVWDVAGPMFAQVLSTGTTVSLENQPFFMNRQGFLDEGYFSFAYTAVRDEHGRAAGIFDFVSETTRQVLAERRFKTLRELSIRTALAQEPAGVLRGAAEVLSHAGHDVPFALLYRVEGGTARLALRSGLEEPGVTPAEFPLSDPAAPWPLAEVLSAGAERLVEKLDTRGPALHAGPWPEPVRRALLLPLSLAGGPEHDAVLVVGLSPRLALDEGYRDFLRLLARQVSADVTRARALEQEKQRAEQLAELDRAKTAFFSNVSHEFRTPLTLMLGPLEQALAQEGLPSEIRTELELMQRNGLRLFKLVNTLLRFSRLEAGRAQARFQPTDLAQLTAGLASAFASATTQGGVRLEVDCPPLPEPVWVDRDSWENIVLNLVSNAFKFTLAGTIAVRLRARPGHVELSVRDTGTGIPAAELPRLFERFHQVRGTRGRGHEGSGIGLALVRELVKLHGGEVRVESTPGQGSTFTVSLPLGHAHLPEAQLEAVPASDPPGRATVAHLHEVSGWLDTDSTRTGSTEGPRTHATEGHILLVDDNADMRDYVRRLLEGRYTVELVADGHAALAAARARPPDLVLSDVMMPGLDGFGLVHSLRAEPAIASVPVILLSARAGEEATVEGLRSGADDYLVKPFSARELLARVEGCLRLARERTGREREALERADFERYLIGIVSHDLRNPLTAITLSATVLRRQPNPDERLRRPLERILSSAERAQRMIRDLLDFTKARLSGGLPMVFQPLDFHALARQVMEELRAAAPGRELSLEQDGDGQASWDGDRVAQVLTNLVSNALNYSPPDTPVRVRTRGEAEAGILEVHNLGPPIAADILPRLFQPLQRGVEGGSLSRSVGLGLYIVEQIVRAHGGTIEVRSEPGAGTLFRARLPRQGKTG